MKGIAAELLLSNLKILFGLCMNYEMVDFLKKNPESLIYSSVAMVGLWLISVTLFLSQLDAYTYNS